MTKTAMLLVLLLAGVPAWAVLGQSVHSVASDQQHLKGQLRTSARQGYSVERIWAANGAEVREYVSPAGMVFGVAWRGSAAPDLRQLLGAYFPAFQQAAQTPRQRRGPLVVRLHDLVVEYGGHMRAYHGRAYVPSLVPATLTPAVVQ